MIVTYIKAHAAEEITALRAFVRNVSDPMRGLPATDEMTDEEGNVIPAQEAIGDPDYFYSSVLAGFLMPLFGGLEAADKETVEKLCGVWAI